MNKQTQIAVDSPVLILVGPTAIGKTALSLEIADTFQCEIISVDSMQVYRYMDIGTAKPSASEMGGVQHHLINVVDPDEQFDAALFVQYALQAIDSITSRGKIPLLTGGTGMYLKALLEGLFDFDTNTDQSIRKDLEEQLEREGNRSLHEQLKKVDIVSAERIHPNDTQRLLRALEIFNVSGIPWSEQLQKQGCSAVKFNKLLQIGLQCDRQLLYERIEKRSNQMMEQGLIDEVEGLRKMGYSPDLTSMQSIGYKHANKYIDGVWDIDEAKRLLLRDTRRYAKRQLTWFGSVPEILWFDRDAPKDVVNHTKNWLND